MSARKHVWSDISRNDHIKLAIDLRTGGEGLRVIALTKNNTDYWRECWYSDEDANDLPCGQRMTPYTPALAASLGSAHIAEFMRDPEREFRYDYNLDLALLRGGVSPFIDMTKETSNDRDRETPQERAPEIGEPLYAHDGLGVAYQLTPGTGAIRQVAPNPETMNIGDVLGMMTKITFEG
jgi:hypothetical protein